MTDEHTAYEEVARERRGSEEYRQGYAEARRAFLIGQAVRERRLALGLSQTDLATRASFGAQIQLAYHHRLARPKRQLFKRPAIFSQRKFRFRSSIQVVKHQLRQAALRQAAQVGNI